jgi:DNA-binding CsgD family transcriptional regulator
MNDDTLIALQRDLRRRFFEGPQAIRWRPGRELIAQLLLYLDDPRQCWILTTSWLRDILDADRVDGGFGGFISCGGRPVDYVVIGEAQRPNQVLPPVMGCTFSACDPGLIAVWDSTALLSFDRVQQASLLTSQTRSELQAVGTASKIAIPMRDGPLPVGIICADWNREYPQWSPEVCLEVARLVRESIGPLMASAIRLGTPSTAESITESSTQSLNMTSLAAWSDLTPAEKRVAVLIAKGGSYKDVARILGRSLSTVDHQLRSIRQKLNVKSTLRLVHLLSEHLDSRSQ